MDLARVGLGIALLPDCVCCQSRVEARLTVARHIDLQLAGIGHHGLPTVAVARVASAVFADQAVVHLRVKARAVSRRGNCHDCEYTGAAWEA